MTISIAGGISLPGKIKMGKPPPTGGPFPVNAVHFDGTNDYLLRGGGLTGASDGQNILMSVWFNLTGDSEGVIIIANGAEVKIRLESDNKIGFRLESSGGASVIYQSKSDSLFDTSNNPGWHHVLFAAQLDGSPVAQIYLDDAILAVTVTDGPTNGNIDFTPANWGIGATVSGAQKLNGDLAELYVTNEYLNISQEINRRKFIDANGFPVDLGITGNTPTGTDALIFFSGDTLSWHTNDGSGGGFTENGALTDAASSPSD